jgi:hypothetical protein
LAGALLTNSSQWCAYLSISATLQWEVWPPFPVKFGAMLGFSVQINFPAGSTPGSTQLTFQIGCIVSISLNLGVVSGSASISLAFGLTITESGSTGITVSLTLTLSVSGSILQGLLGVTFTVEAGAALTLTSPQSFQATFGASIDVQICWCLDISFSISFQLSHQLSL